MSRYKEITLIGDFLGDAGVAGQSGWVLTAQGPKYKVGPSDSPALLAKRYLGDHRGEHHIMAMQTREVQRRGLRTGDVIAMPPIAVERANSLGLIRGLSGFAGSPDDERLTRHTGMGGLAAGHDPYQHGYWRLPPSPSEAPQRSPSRRDLGGFSDTIDAYTNGHQLQESINVTIETLAATVNQDQTTSKKIDADTYTAWDAFHRGWVDFRNHEPSPAWLVAETLPYLNTLNDRYAAMKGQWQPGATGWAQRIKTITGGLVGPTPEPSPPTAPETDSASGTVKWIALAVIVAAGAYAAGPFLRSMKRGR
jgi:hypothetical protein